MGRSACFPVFNSYKIYRIYCKCLRGKSMCGIIMQNKGAVMKISTKGRYALRIMIDIAEHEPQITSVNELAARQEISVKYAEAIVGALSRAGLLVSRRGKNGPVTCFRKAPRPSPRAISCARAKALSLRSRACPRPSNPCPRAAGCKTLPFWRALDRHIAGFCDSVSLSALVTGEFLP